MEDGGDGADHPAALQGILRKLSAGLDNLIAGTSFPRMRSLLADLKSGDDSRTIGALTELCNMLSMATDESMIAFSVDQFVPVLVDLLGQDSNPNIMLLAARSLTNLIEVLPAAGEVLVHRGAVPILVSKLLCIEYMDVAEQALECLERLSRDNAQPILQSGGLTAALAFLDFFSTGLQCVSLNLAASICHSMQPSGCDLVVETIPVLTNVLTYQDTRIVDSAISCFHSLSRAFKNSEADLATIAAHGLLNRVLEVVAARESVSGAAHRPVNFTMLIQILAIHCRHSADTVQTVINSGMIDMLHSVLSASGRMQTNEDEDEQIKIAARPSEQLAEILQLCYELLPPLPPAMARFVWSEAELAEMDLEQYEGGMHPKTLLFHKCPSLLITYGDSLFGLLLQVYAESMALNVRHRALASISAIIYHMTAPMLDSLLARKPFSGFCADLLASGEAPTAMTALQMCSVLMDRLPVVFHHQLLREGVIDAIHTMRSLEGVAKLFTCDEEHSARLCECASQFWSTHVLPSLDSSGSITKTLALSKLLVLAEKLAEFGALGADSGADASAVLTEIFQLLVVGEGVSVFEFQGSKLTEALIAFLDPMHDDLNQRIRCVLDCAIRTNNSDPANGLQRVSSASSTQPITVLVRLLSGCVDKLEHFAVMLHSSVTNLAVGLKVLTQPFKLCLKRDPSESLSSSLQDYSSNVVLIEPLATVTAVEEFLWAKVHEADVDELDEMPDGAAPRGERLTLRMRGLQLDQKSTIFQAIYEATSGENCVEGEEEYKISHKVWEQVHIITYSLHKPEDTSSPMSPVWTKLAAEQSNQEVHTNMAALAAQVMLKVSEASDNTKEWGFLSTALHLLSTLNWVCSLWNHFCSPETLQQIVPTGIDTRGGDSSALLASHCFVSAKLTNKLMRQLQDPLVLCSGGLPPWCLTLVSNAGFVLPFECRRLFFQYTSLGISRALHIMQHRAQQSENGQASPTRGANLSSNSEFRLGRIQRQKARVHRQRILMSAVKVLELCTGHKAVLEVEFSGEAGTGTGPTLEFFTLVSREVQRKDLNMWYQSETSKQLAPRTQETELVFTPPAEDVHMHNVHRIAVLHCPHCNHTVFPVSPHSGELLTVSIDEGQAAACTQEPGEPQVRADSTPCASCACEQPMSLLWWIVFDDEAQYLAKAFPSGVATLQHMVLQCPCCHSVNFPGTEHTLTINRNGKMYSASGRRLHEHEYRAVTQHASSLCENVPLKQVPVALSQEVVDGMVQALQMTPELIEEPADNEFKDSHAGVKEYVHIGDGMFPHTVAPGESCGDVILMFQFLGRFVAKAVMDGRLVDLPFNAVFWKAVLMRHLSLSDVSSIDRQLGASLETMNQVGVQYETAAKMENPVDRQAAIDAITLDGAKVEDLCLDFTLPGRPEIQLVPSGADREVTAENIGEYVQLIGQMLLHDGVQQQVEAFRTGFIDILPLDGLLNFSEEEIDTLVCGDSKFWDVASFIEQIHCDRGFNPESPAIRYLAEILDEMDPVEKRLFLRFATGSPKLPVDGLRGLNPPLTVVLKPPEQGWTPDDYLPSVMTCTNYLKLPNYSTKDIMRTKLMMAIKEGHISFHLS